MYMDNEYNLNFKDLVLMTDKNGNLTCGGFTINNSLLNNSLNNSNIQHGGGDVESLKQLNHLGIPPGLIFNPAPNKRNASIKYEHMSEYCANNVYDKLLNLVDMGEKKKYSIKTKKKKNNKKKLSKKSK
jgi:hypothetical protein